MKNQGTGYGVSGYARGGAVKRANTEDEYEDTSGSGRMRQLDNLPTNRLRQLQNFEADRMRQLDNLPTDRLRQLQNFEADRTRELNNFARGGAVKRTGYEDGGEVKLGMAIAKSLGEGSGARAMREAENDNADSIGKEYTQAYGHKYYGQDAIEKTERDMERRASKGVEGLPERRIYEDNRSQYARGGAVRRTGYSEGGENSSVHVWGLIASG